VLDQVLVLGLALVPVSNIAIVDIVVAAGGGWWVVVLMQLLLVDSYPPSYYM